MTGDFVLAGKLAIGLACVGAMILLLRHPKPYALENKSFDRLALLVTLASRLGLFVVLYLVMGFEVRADVASAYFPQGNSILEGQMVYRDFDSSYSPLFPYLMAGVLLIWNSAKAIVLSMIPIELISLPFWLAVSRRHFSETTTRTAMMLYVLSPVPLLNIAMNGQNQVWISLFLAISLWLLAKKDFTSGFLIGISLALIKLLSLLYAPVLWLFASKRSRWMIGFVLIPIGVYGLFYAMVGDDLFYPIRRQGDHVTSGNLYFLAGAFGMDSENATAKMVSSIIMVSSLALVFLVAWAKGVHKNPANVIHLLSIVLLTLFLFSKKSYASYFVLSFFTICLSVASPGLTMRGILLFGVFSILAALEPTMYFRWLKPNDFSVLFASELPEGQVRWKGLVFLGWDIALLLTYAWYSIQFWKRLNFGEPKST